VKQVLNIGQFATIETLAFCLGLLKIGIDKTNTWRKPSQSRQKAPFKMCVSIWRSVV